MSAGENPGFAIRPLAPADARAAADVWNRCCDEPEGPLYRGFPADEFDALFREPADDFAKVSLVATDRDRVVGFANGTVRPGADRAYVTAVMVARERRHRRVGTRLVAELERALAAAPGAGAVERYEVVFFNPITLTWLIPGTDGHDHPNSPGVDVHGDGYVFLKNRGYRDFAYQNSYYLPLAEYVPPANIDEIRRRLSDAGLRICRYEPERHTGLDAADGSAEPVLIVEDGNRACGFTGPLHVQPSGRGYFAGIGVHSDYRGRGAAKALFSGLCTELKGMGADFMSLFTGETNPARNIYEAAGFRIVRCWADMRKEIRR